MSELSEITAELASAHGRDETIVLATVVRTEGSVYRRMGARMLVRADDTTQGAVSGGCLEADIVARARTVRESKMPRLITYDTRSSEDIVWGLGLGCQGVVEVLLQPLSGDTLLRAAGAYAKCAESERPLLLATVIHSERDIPHLGDMFLCEADHPFALQPSPPFVLQRDNAGEAQADVVCRVQTEAEEVLRGGRSLVREYVTGAGVRYQVAYEVVSPPISLLICGAGHDAVPVARLARELGWRVTVADHRAGYARVEHFPNANVLVMRDAADLREAHTANQHTAAVVMAHHYERDRAALEMLLDANAPYIGMLGPRRRTEQMLRELAEAGRVVTPEQQARIYGPVGLNLGSETPAEIALAIVAEVQAVMRGHSAGLLRDSAGPIHALETSALLAGSKTAFLQNGTSDVIAPACAIAGAA